jgi:putative flippase GtrA
MAITFPDMQPERRQYRASRSLAAALGQLLDRVPRLIRFGAVGSLCAICQLILLSLLVHARTEAHVANTLAFLASTQLNFVLSSLITWRDRRSVARSFATVGRRLLGYNTLSLGSLLINQLAFAVALRVVPYLGAALVGILAGMLLTYVISGRFLFRRPLAQVVGA